jgi:hypothetical protein
VLETFPGAVRVAPRRRNFCVVNFDGPESAQAAVARNGQPVSQGSGVYFRVATQAVQTFIVLMHSVVLQLCGSEGLRIELAEH